MLLYLHNCELEGFAYLTHLLLHEDAYHSWRSANKNA